MKSALVFLSASNNISPIYFSEIEILGRELAKNNIQIVFGGSCMGLMGCLADAALKAGGKVVGVIPHYLNKPGISHDRLTELIEVDDLLDRKKKMLSLSDIVIASPGGVGTIDEITEVIALKQLSEHSKPVVFHNFMDYWRPMLEYFDELHLRGMISQEPNSLYSVTDRAEDIISFVKAN